MQDTTANKRTDSASAIIRSAPRLSSGRSWMRKLFLYGEPPKGMKCHIYEFNPQVGGTFRMSDDYADMHNEVSGKTTAHADIFHGRFLELVSDKRIVERVEFESGDPAFAGEMTITTTLVPVSGGTEVTFAATKTCRNSAGGSSQRHVSIA